MALARLVVSMAAAASLVACASSETNAVSYSTVTTSGCLEWTGQPIERVCLPREAREGASLTFEIESSRGSCGAHVDRCTATVDGRDVTLSIDGRSCPSDGTCAAPARRVTCKIPALAGGSYAVRLDDGSGRVQTLAVGTSADARDTCAFAAAP